MAVNLYEMSLRWRSLNGRNLRFLMLYLALGLNSGLVERFWIFYDPFRECI
jgi:hypothetical protein